MNFELTKEAVDSFARAAVDAVKDFYKDPENQAKYREWHIQKYGCEPKE